MTTSLRIALCQINTVPGDLPGNVLLIREAARRARNAAADLAVFPELAVVGYSPRDLLFRRRLVARAEEALAEIAEESRGIGLLVGTVKERSGPGRPFSNVAVLLDQGREVATIAKQLLPVYDVFDEARYFEPGGPSQPVEFRGVRLGVTVCEDLWTHTTSVEAPGYPADPAAALAAAGAELIINLSASPFHGGKPSLREEVVCRTARRTGRPVALCNLYGGNDEILFDGSSVAATAAGEVVARGARFREDLVIVDFARPGPPLPPRNGDDVQELREALVLGVADYARKCGFRSAVLGLSGGVDSAVTACLAVEALGRDGVRGVALPSRFSSAGSIDDALDLARRLGIRCDVVPIDGAYRELLARAEDVVGAGDFGLMEENLQARIRGVILMAVSNRTGALLVTTGNKSEMAVGYCTLYGDMCGGLAAISDVFKTDVYRLARHYAELGLLPERSITKAPSAELRPNQRDQDSLPEYDLLDRVLALHIDLGLGTADIVAALPGVERALVDRVLSMVARSEYKRKQAAPGLRVTRKAFGYGRRVPLVASSLAFLDEAAARRPKGSTT